jgi:ribosomal protein S18 acetylase RimI-like enzyme
LRDIIFRRVKESDLNDVYVLLNQLKELDQDSIDKERAWKNFLKNISVNSIVGILDGKIVAYGSVVIENKIRGEVAGHIEDIVVDKNVGKKMIGTYLVKELIEICKKKKCYRITLFCNEKLVNFYSRNGFKVNNVMMKKFLDY